MKIRFCRKVLFLLALLFPGELAVFSQATDYGQIFGKDWELAGEFVRKNEKWMKELTDRYDVPYDIAVAVVFPELVRYSALLDKIEITLLKSLYVSLGDEYANFSVGRFQMKPSFAEAVNTGIQLFRNRLRNKFRQKSEFDAPWKYRSAIVSGLEDPESQFLYLIAFLKICEHTYDLKEMGDEQKVKFLSTAYNYSFLKTADDVNSMSDKRFFSTKLAAEEYYCYSDISLAWFKKYKESLTLPGNKN
jgi:hypothetical protein